MDVSSIMHICTFSAPMADADEDGLRIGDGFFILDIVAGQKPPAVPLEGGELREYEQVCGITASPSTSARRGTVLLSSTMLNEVRVVSAFEEENFAAQRRGRHYCNIFRTDIYHSHRVLHMEKAIKIWLQVLRLRTRRNKFPRIWYELGLFGPWC